MKKVYCTKCKKYKEFKKPKISYICDKTLLLSSICNKCESEDEKIFKEEELIDTINTITNAFQKILDESNRQPNKTWVDKGSEFYNRSMKS